MLFWVACPRFVDDFFGADRSDDRHSADGPDSPTGAADMARFVMQDLLGWELDESKAVTDGHAATVLGVSVSFSECFDEAIFEVPQDKCEQWTHDIMSVLEAGELSPTAAQKLAGKLSWGCTYIFNRSARVFLAPLFRQACGRARSLSGRVRRALEWWLRLLATRLVRRVPLQPRELPRLILYTDATGGASVAWVAVFASMRVFARAAIPRRLRDWVQPRKAQISTWELIAAVCGLWQIFHLIRGSGA